MNKRFIAILAACIIAFAGLLILTKKDSKTPSEQTDNNPSSQLSNHIKGQGTTGVTLTEYGDFACPACYQYFPIVQQVKEKYGDQIKFQFRHYPLTEIHQNALVSARAAEAAGKQNKFFEMHDLLYQNQPTWRDSSNPTPLFENYANQLGLDLSKFKEDVKNSVTNATVQADRAEARRLNYSSTPTFEVDGKQVENPRSLEDFTKLIDNAIKEKQAQKQQ
ncbi:MAG TPA: thioredoxin domain-containing protein [Verrucomicrobiae bacterium]|nr:thioredoxin domain-containing protein [Verrucomicrobiae bacterium]